MRLGDLIEFRNDLYFGGAVQADWFYDRENASLVAENFVFHSKNYFGVDGQADSIDTVSLLKILAGKFGKASDNPRSLAIADYGTGKSHLAVTLGVLFSGPDFMPKTYHKIIDNIRMIDAESASDISSLCKDRNFVIMLNGIRDFNLHSEILKATQRSLRLYGIDDSELKKINHTVETANRFFELNSNSHLADFEKAAVKRGWKEKGNTLLTKISEGIGTDDNAFEIINDVYELVTGQRIRWEEGISAKSILEKLLSTYCGLNGKFENVVILFDEFGRYLEYASGTDGGKSGDNALQELFEVSQNASGTLQIINFIQTDIKTYLLRVDQSRNLNRYIGRYDESDKYHISSNIETVFANLVARKDVSIFNKTVVSWQKSKEHEWKDIFEKLNKWTQTSGIWSDYNKFRKVIVEGIYPMHPISVYMLSRLSDYLQNRSSMNLISQYITSVSDVDISKEMPYVLPTELMSGDLFSEMLSAETSGRHRSDNCIRFENILKKNGQKFNEKHISVLRANLISRALRFNTRNYAEAKYSLMLCSGLSETELDEALTYLVDEYAVLAFDEMAGCFDFTEDAKGAYSYKILKQRLLAKQDINLRSLFKTATILDLGGFIQNQQTNFGTNHKILTNEWCFTQELMLEEDMDDNVAISYVKQWKEAKSVVVPKGKLIWIYVNKDTDYHATDRLKKIAAHFNGTPIVMMYLNDSDNMLKKALVEYELLDHMDEKTKNDYKNIFEKDFEKVQTNIKNAFDYLKKKRLYISANGLVQWKKRISISLTEIFDIIYPDIISYNFDGLLTSSNNFTGNGAKYYCQILRTLLSNSMERDTVFNFPIDVRNRIDALFMVDNVTSWKCLTSDCVIAPPQNEKAKNIYNLVYQEIEKQKSYDCGSFFNRFCAPPYGLSEEAAAMFLGMVIANLWHNIRIQYDNIKESLIEWTNEVVKDKKLRLDIFKETTLLWIDIGTAESKFQQLFQKISSNKEIDLALTLEQQRQALEKQYGIPDTLTAHNQLALQRFQTFEMAKQKWYKDVGDMQANLQKAVTNRDVLKALEIKDSLIAKSKILFKYFNDSNVNIPQNFLKNLQQIQAVSSQVIEKYFSSWLLNSVFCKSIDKMSSFANFCMHCQDLFTKNGYGKFADEVEKKCQKELANKEEIKSRTTLVEDANKFVLECQQVSEINYIEIESLIKRSNNLQERFKKYVSGMGAQATELNQEVLFYAGEIQEIKSHMDSQMNLIYDSINNAKTVIELTKIKELFATVLGYNIDEDKRANLKALQNVVDELSDDCNEVMSKYDNRTSFKKIKEMILDKYTVKIMGYNFRSIVDDSIELTKKKMDLLDKKWCDENVTLGDRSRQFVHIWKEKINTLPAYLSNETIEKIKLLDAEADQLISEGKIEDVIFYFDKLDEVEKEKCLDLLKTKC